MYCHKDETLSEHLKSLATKLIDGELPKECIKESLTDDDVELLSHLVTYIICTYCPLIPVGYASDEIDGIIETSFFFVL